MPPTRDPAGDKLHNSPPRLVYRQRIRTSRGRSSGRAGGAKPSSRYLAGDALRSSGNSRSGREDVKLERPLSHRRALLVR